MRSRLDAAVGRVLGGRFRLLAPLGTGASATVYVAQDIALKRRVAVKVLHAALAEDQGFLRRFRSEAQVAAALNHPNVMGVHDWGEHDGEAYLVLELFAGGSLRDVLDSGRRLTVSQAAAVGLQAARALEHAHRRGLVHRDIKPANLLFHEDGGRLAIADFGLARALAEAAWTEPGGTLLGTVRYAAPEQAQGGKVDGKADVYALALVLIEAVTGSVPFAADTTIATLMARVGRDVEVPAAMGALQEIVRRAGSADPDLRPDAHTFARALDAALDELPAPVRLPLAPPTGASAGRADDMTELAPAMPVTTVAMPSPRRRRVGGARPWWQIAAIAVVLVGLLAGGAYAVVQARIPSHEVPTLRGKTLDEARVVARPFDLSVVERRYEDDTVAGEILNQEPPSGMLKENRAIKVVVSRGPPLVAVPDLTGKTETEAGTLLTEAGFKVVGSVARPFDEAVPEGVLLNWSHKGERRPKGSNIALTVSAGPKPVTLPDIFTRHLDSFRDRLTSLGFGVKLEEAYSDDVDAGAVITTKPAPGEAAKKGSEVTVVVSKGPETVSVPDVRGDTVGRATQRLAAVGLEVSAVYGPRDGAVFATNPERGAKVKRGSKVDLYMRGGRGN